MHEFRRLAVVAGAAMVPAVCAAQTSGSDTASTLGRVIGILLFGYIVMKLFNRKKGDVKKTESGREPTSERNGKTAVAHRSASTADHRAARTTANPYAPPSAAVADYANPSQGGEAAAPFFAVSLTKLTVLSLCTLSLYEMYWFYKNWKLIRAREESGVIPALRAIFSVIFCYSCFARIRDHGTKLGVVPPFAAGALAAAWIVLTIMWKLPDPYWLLTLFAALALLPVQAYANKVNAMAAPDHDPNSKFSGWNWVAVVLGGAFVILAIIGTLLPAK